MTILNIFYKTSTRLSRTYHLHTHVDQDGAFSRVFDEQGECYGELDLNNPAENAVVYRPELEEMIELLTGVK